VEEAQTVRKKSWELLIPTIRKEDSEIWVSFNPDLPTDDTYKRFILNSPPGAAVVWMSWKDNPWFPEVLRIEKDHLQATDLSAFENVWEGKPKSEISGAIYAAELKKAREDGRITKVPADRTRPVHTFWDLGFGDTNAIWFAQALPGGTFRIVDYEQCSGLTIADYVVKLQERKYMYGTDYVPHDGVDAMIHHRLTGDKTKSPEMLLRAAGRKVIVVPKLLIATGVNAVRTIFPNCWFDEDKCADGIQGLAHYQWSPETASGVQSRIPLHNWASHPADGFRTLAVGIKTPAAESKPAAAAEEEYSWMA
jgi:phage terminase large subunit